LIPILTEGLVVYSNLLLYSFVLRSLLKRLSIQYMNVFLFFLSRLTYSVCVSLEAGAKYNFFSISSVFLFF
jgi:hypothetical protein